VTTLLTGGAGLLALNWAMTMRDREHVVLGLHRRRVQLAGVRCEQLDLSTEAATLDLCRRVAPAPACIVHTAALTNVDLCEREPMLARRVNVDAARHVAKACATLGIALVHISTDHLFAGDQALQDETAPVAPRNVYGRSKADAEDAVLEAYPASLVIRTNFYGWGPSHRRSFSDTIIDSMRAGATVTLFQDAFYTPILIEPLVETVTALRVRGASGIYHVAGDERLSKHDFGVRLARRFGLDERLIVPGWLGGRPDLVSRPADMSLSNELASARIGRRMGGPDEHIERLYEQERSGYAAEVKGVGRPASE